MTNVYTAPTDVELDWNEGNLDKCQKHGVSTAEIEGLLTSGLLMRLPDPFPDEPRMRGIGKAPSGRYVFIVYTIRESGTGLRLRPISARYMHDKEIRHYEQQQAARPDVQD